MKAMNERKFSRCNAIAYYRITEPKELDLQNVEIEFEYDSIEIFNAIVMEQAAEIIRKRCVESYQSFEVVEIIDTKDGRVLFKEPTY